MPSAPSIIEVRDLTHFFGELEVLRKINFRANRGEFLAILGASGCGKTTLLRILSGFLTPTHGNCLLSGSQIVGPGLDRGLIGQHYELFPWLSALANVEFSLRRAIPSRRERRRVAHQWLKDVGLAEFAHALPHQLSGGMQQRVAVARAFSSGAQVLLLDEPFGALDEITRIQMCALLANIWQKHKRTVLFISHNIEDIMALSTRVLVLTPRPAEIFVDRILWSGPPASPPDHVQRADLERDLRNDFRNAVKKRLVNR